MKKTLLACFVLLCTVFCADASEKLEIFTEEFLPFNYLQKQGDKTVITGFCYDIVKEIQKRIGDNSPISMSIWTTAYDKVKTTKNTAIFSMGKNPLREKEFKFVGPLADNAFILFSKAGSKIEIKELEDAKPYRIGVYKDDAAEQFLRIQGFNNLLVADTDEGNLNRLLEGAVDLWISSELKAYRTAASAGEKPDSIRGTFVAFMSSLYIAFNNDTDSKLVEKWQEALDKIKEDGTFGKIRNQWVEKLKNDVSTTKKK